jgi:hypothetical protein
LAELHDGSLHIESEKGAGTTVTLQLLASRVVTTIAELVGDAQSHPIGAEKETLKAEG